MPDNTKPAKHLYCCVITSPSILKPPETLPHVRHELLLRMRNVVLILRLSSFESIMPWITDDSVAALLDLVVRYPRSSQLLLDDDEHPDGSTWKSPPISLHPREPKSGLLQSLEYLMKCVLHHVHVVRHPMSSQSTGKQVKSASKFRHSAVEDDQSVTSGSPGDTQSSRSPAVAYASAFGDVDVILYSAAGPATMSVYRLKSSAFDLFVALAIGSYLAVLYFISKLPCVEQPLKNVTR
ncbi:hypothetical protein PHET_11862 [Paragonimus heterotremus]|uniref:Uncharacterized protein n=1 Tax=Paragonimus heterotremus TaxID=100268 RepID=A0A8J4SRI3_9TREM|nr:hypothetical protein PHET_11862 [Paragonimus heterotremus]